MKIVVLAVLLSVVQAAPPVPRQAANDQAGTRSSVKNHPETKQKPAPPPSPSKDNENCSYRNQDHRAQPPANNASQPIVITESAPMPKKDWWDKAAVIGAWVLVDYTLLLVIAGSAGVFAAVKTLKAVERQATVMRGQIAEMSAQTEVLNKSVDVAQKNATAAEQNVAIFRSKERARIEVREPNGMAKLSPNILPRIIFIIELKGLTPPTIIDARAFAQLSESMEPPEFTGTFIPPIAEIKTLSLENRVVEASSWVLPQLSVTQEDIDCLEQGKKFIHFWGKIVYRDVFYDVFPEERITAFRYCFGYSQSSLHRGLGISSGAWIKVGPAEDNRQT